MPPQEPTAHQRLRLVKDAISDRVLPATATPPQIRTYLRNNAIPCTPTQARAVHHMLQTRGASGHEEPPAARRTETLGSRLMAARKAKFLSRADLAKTVGCSESYLSYLETGARSPSADLLSSLGTALDKEPEWLRSGSASQATKRIVELLRFGRYALVHGDLPEAARCLGELLDGDLGRPLRRDELDETTLLRAWLFTCHDRHREAVELLHPLVRRVLDRDCTLPPILLGQRYLGAALDVFMQDRGIGVEVPLRATTLAGQLLGMVDRTSRDDSWWRLAATTMSLYLHLGSYHFAIAMGEAWLDELGPDGAEASPSGVAALRWNLGIAAAKVEQYERALIHLEAARSLHDAGQFPLDAARLQSAYAGNLIRIRPERAEEAIRILEAAYSVFERFNAVESVRLCVAQLAEAKLKAGRPDEAEAIARKLLDDPSSEKSYTRVWALIWVGDSYVARDRLADAKLAYDDAVESLKSAGLGRAPVREWRWVADRLHRLGYSDDAIMAYQQALRVVDHPDAVARPGGPDQPDGTRTGRPAGGFEASPTPA